ncbi:hypothetical protein GF351_02720 [Candidatus Woesearchaeota archaeon]|nr:hypothetical protein [Candidatus Woesearchaeota archaeon]
MNSELSIIRLFFRDISRELTINQISKELKKSYAYTNKEVRKLLSENILNKKIIGPSIVCSLNLQSDKTILLLSYISAEEKEGFGLQNKAVLQKLEDIARKLASQAAVYSAFFAKKRQNSLTLVCEDEMKVRGLVSSMTGIKFEVVPRSGFTRPEEEIIIVHGFESFWRLANA